MVKQRRERLILPSLVILGCLAAFAWALHQGRERARAQVGREDQALAMLRSLEEAQRAQHKRAGRFGWLDELALTQTMATDAQGKHFEHAGYRFDALLPGKRHLTPALQLVTQAAKSEDRELSTKHFVLVARPVDAGVSGYRTFYLDETGLVWINEGVSDEETLQRNPLPLAHLATSEGKDVSGRVWKRLDTLKPRGTDEWKR